MKSIYSVLFFTVLLAISGCSMVCRTFGTRTPAGSGFQNIPLPSEQRSSSTPSEHALNFFGLTEFVESEKEELEKVEVAEGRQTIYLTQRNLADDSVEAIQYRLEYLQDSEKIWNLNRAYRRQKCRRGESTGRWTSLLCP